MEGEERDEGRRDTTVPWAWMLRGKRFLFFFELI